MTLYVWLFVYHLAPLALATISLTNTTIVYNYMYVCTYM
jgi:hypothetical protein